MPAFGVYVHVPYCASRCGYCDFNTYTDGRGREDYVAAVVAELRRAPRRPAQTVFFGGGTPTLLTVDEIGEILSSIEAAPGAEVAVEANPETVDARYLAGLRALGVTRVSFGMQSAADHVLRSLDRRHTRGRALAAVAEARATGFAAVSVDLIYGAHGERDEDWSDSLEAVLSVEPDHVSAYGLTVERGTRLAAQIRRGLVPAPDEDAQRRRYVMADERLTAAGLAWHEVSSWGEPCRHNVGYWTGGEWFGAGPGAHSAIGGERWWNRRDPRGWARAVLAGESGVAGRETLTAGQRRLERLMLGMRTSHGLPAADLPAAEVTALIGDGLLARQDDRVVVTLDGRLLADYVVRRLAR